MGELDRGLEAAVNRERRGTGVFDAAERSLPRRPERPGDAKIPFTRSQAAAEPTIDSGQLATMLGGKDLVILQLQREIARLQARVEELGEVIRELRAARPDGEERKDG